MLTHDDLMFILGEDVAFVIIVITMVIIFWPYIRGRK